MLVWRNQEKINGLTKVAKLRQHLWWGGVGGVVAVLRRGRSELAVLEVLLRVLLEVSLVRVRGLAHCAHVAPRCRF